MDSSCEIDQMAVCVRTAFKRLLESADDDEIAKMYKMLSRPRFKNGAEVKPRPRAQWKPKNSCDARLIVDLLMNDAGLRIAEGCIHTCEPNMKIVCAEVVDQIRNKKGIVDRSRATTVGLSVNVASVMARAVEEAKSILALEKITGCIIEKRTRSDAPSWAAISCRGSGVSFNAEGKVVFMRALDVISTRLAVLE